MNSDIRLRNVSQEVCSASRSFILGFVLAANNQAKEAIPFLEKALSVSDRSPGVIGVLVRAYAHSGRRADALRLLAELKRRKQAVIFRLPPL